MPVPFLFTNFFLTELITGVGVSDTILNIPPQDALRMQLFTSNQFYAPLVLWDGQTTPPEIVWCNQNPQNGQLMVLRGQEGTSAFGWGAGTQVRSTVSAGVLNAALQAYNTGLILMANYLPLAGGTLTGPLILSEDPQVNLEAATKHYVDSTEALYLPLTGGTLSGNLSLNGNKILSVADPTADTDAANKEYVDGIHTAINNIFRDRSGVLLTAGTPLAYTVATTAGSYTPANGGVPDGTRLSLEFHASNQANPTLAVDGSPALPLAMWDAMGVPPGYLQQAGVADVVKSGPVWIVVTLYRQPGIGTTGTSTAYIATTDLNLAALEDGIDLELLMHTSNTGPATLAVDGLAAEPLRVVSGVDLYSGTLTTNAVIPVRYNAATSEWLVKGPAVPPIVVPMNMGTTDFYNLSIVVTTNSGLNQSTVALKQVNGNDPTVAQPIQIAFTNPAGGTVWRQVTAPLALLLGPGTTFGQGTNPFRLWLLALDDGGTVALGAICCAQQSPLAITPLDEEFPWTAPPIAGGANSAGQLYANIAVNNVSARIIGVLDYNSGLSSPGNFNAPPTYVNVFTSGMKLPGDTVQVVFNSGGPNLSITPRSPMNFFKYAAGGVWTLPPGSQGVTQWRRGTTVLSTKTFGNGVTAGNIFADAVSAILDNPNTAATVSYNLNETTTGSAGFTPNNGMAEEIQV